MQKGHKKLILVEMIIIIISMFSFFLNNFLSGYKMFIFLLLVAIFIRKTFKIEKETPKTIKDIILEMTVFLNTFFILYYLFGLLIGFTRSGNYYSWNGFFKVIIPLSLYIILREYLRFHLLEKTKNNNLLTIITIIMFVSLDLSYSLYSLNYKNVYGIVMHFILSILPLITNNLVNSYITKRSGYLPVTFYSLIIGLYSYILPIVPNANIFLMTMLNGILPILLWVRIHSFYERSRNGKIEENNNKLNILILIIPSILVALIIYIFSGYFRYYAIAIASTSMEPEINRGDIVLLDQKIKNTEERKIGEVIAYKKDNSIVIHRIVAKEEKDGKYIYYTKGDASENRDSYGVKEEQIIGIVNWKIRYLGLPTVWLNDL